MPAITPKFAYTDRPILAVFVGPVRAVFHESMDKCQHTVMSGA